MINPYKNSENIYNFYVNTETNVKANMSNTLIKDLGTKCKPDMDWIYNKCMMKSADFRNMLEKNYYTTYQIIDPYIRKNPDLLKKFKKRLVNNSDNVNYYDVSTVTPVFNDCALLYQDLCRNFYENKSITEEFRLN